jgi:hypothetical protein
MAVRSFFWFLFYHQSVKARNTMLDHPFLISISKTDPSMFLAPFLRGTMGL